MPTTLITRIVDWTTSPPFWVNWWTGSLPITCWARHAGRSPQWLLLRDGMTPAHDDDFARWIRLTAIGSAEAPPPPLQTIALGVSVRIHHFSEIELIGLSLSA